MVTKNLSGLTVYSTLIIQWDYHFTDILDFTRACDIIKQILIKLKFKKC